MTALCDVTANVIGAFLGGLSSEAVRAAFVRAIRILRAHGMAASPALYPALVGLAAAVVSEWEPFNVSLDVGEVVSKLKILRSDPFQFAGFNDEGVVFFRFLLAGFAVHSRLRQTRYRERATAITVAGMTIMGIGLDGCQLFIGARLPGVEDTLVIVSGVITGAALARWHVERLRPVVLTALWQPGNGSRAPRVPLAVDWARPTPSPYSRSAKTSGEILCARETD